MWMVCDGPFETTLGGWRVESRPIGEGDRGWPVYRLAVADVASGRTLVEADVHRLQPRLWRGGDGVNLALVQGSQSYVFRLDAATATFRAAGGADEPIAELGRRIACLLDEGAPYSRWESPDGLLRIETEYTQWHTNSSSDAPRITDLRTGDIVLDLLGTRWDGYPVPDSDGGVSMRLRHPDGASAMSISICSRTGTFRILDDAGIGSRERPLAQLETLLTAVGDRP